MWGRTTVYLQLFGVNISSMLPTSNHRLDLAFVIDSSDWTLSPRHKESAYLSPLTTGLVQSPTGRIISPSKVFKMLKINLFYLIEFCSQIYKYIILYI